MLEANSEQESSQNVVKTEEDFISALLNTENFRSYMLNTYEIVPMLINRHRIRQFIEETSQFEPYTKHIDGWNNLK